MALTKGQGKKLIEIIESHDWQLIDVSDNPEGWDEINTREPAEDLLGVKKQYLFVPKPLNGETYRDSYAIANEKCLKPSLTVDGDGKDYEGWIAIDIFQNPHIFSRLFIPDRRSIVASCPGFEAFVAMKADKVIDIFKKYFSIADYRKTKQVEISWER